MKSGVANNGKEKRKEIQNCVNCNSLGSQTALGRYMSETLKLSSLQLIFNNVHKVFAYCKQRQGQRQSAVVSCHCIFRFQLSQDITRFLIGKGREARKFTVIERSVQASAKPTPRMASSPFWPLSRASQPGPSLSGPSGLWWPSARSLCLLVHP